MDPADSLKRLGMLDARRRIAAEGADVEGPAQVVPQLFEADGGVDLAVSQQQRRAVAARTDAAVARLQPAPGPHEEGGRCRPHPRFLWPSLDHAPRQPRV